MEIFSIDSSKMFYKVIRSRSIDGEHLNLMFLQQSKPGSQVDQKRLWKIHL